MSKRRVEVDLSALDTGVDPIGRTLYLVGEIDEAMAARALVTLDLFSDVGSIRVALSSSGGEVAAGMTIYDAIRSFPYPVVVDVFGRAQSMAMLILQAGSVRRASPQARLMLHQGTACVGEVGTLLLPAIAQEITRGHELYCKLLADRSGMDVEAARALCASESYMSPEEAIEKNLLDEVLPWYNPMKVAVRKRRRKR